MKRSAHSQDELCLQEPAPQIKAHPNPNNILEWHYVIEGHKGSHFEGGVYHGKSPPCNLPAGPSQSILLWTLSTINRQHHTKSILRTIKAKFMKCQEDNTPLLTQQHDSSLCLCTNKLGLLTGKLLFQPQYPFKVRHSNWALPSVL